MHCPHCNAEIDLRDTFCRACGQPLSLEQTKTADLGPAQINITTHTSRSVICGGCGAKVPLGEQTCPSCGHALPSQEEIQSKLAHARVSSASGQARGLTPETLKCPHCGSALSLHNGLCTVCGQHVELPAALRQALGKAISGSSTQFGLKVGSFQASARFKMSMVNAGLLVAALGVLMYLWARQHAMPGAPLSPLHIGGLLCLGVAVCLVIAGKTRSQ